MSLLLVAVISCAQLQEIATRVSNCVTLTAIQRNEIFNELFQLNKKCIIKDND